MSCNLVCIPATYVYRTFACAYLCEKHRARRGPNQSRYLNEGDARIYVRACASHRVLVVEVLVIQLHAYRIVNRYVPNVGTRPGCS